MHGWARKLGVGRPADGVLRSAAKLRPNPDLWPKSRAHLEPLRFRRAPLLAAAVWFALGEGLARFSWQPTIVLVLAVAALVGLVGLALRRSPRAAIVPVAALWIVAGFWSVEVRPVPSNQAVLLRYADGLSRTVRGRVVRVRALAPPVPTGTEDAEAVPWNEREEPSPEAGAISVDLVVDAVEEVTPDRAWMTPVQGGVRATLSPEKDDAVPLPALNCGDIVQAPMRLKVPERYRDPGAWQYAEYLLVQGVGAQGSVSAEKLERVGKAQADVQCRLYAAQSWAAGRISAYVGSRVNRRLPKLLRLSADDAGMLNAMLFGDRAGLNHGLRLGFERTGSFHLFVVSGMHVALVAGGLFWIARRLRLRESFATLLTLAFTFGYALLTGFGAPVQRALWMTTVFLLARLLSRDRSVLNALGAAALGVLVWSPAALFEASFQMTFLAIVAIGGIAVPLAEWSFVPYARAAQGLDDVWMDSSLPPELAEMRVMLRTWGEAFAAISGQWAYRVPGLFVRGVFGVLELALIGAVAEMVMVLPMAVYFHRATMFALPANMVSVPVVAMLVPMAVATFAGTLLSPWLALVPGAATALLLHAITGIIGAVSHLRSADLRMPGPVWWVVVLVVLSWAFCCWAVRRSGRWAAVAALVLPAAAVLVLLSPGKPVLTPGALEVTAIDVGQGDSIFVVSPDGQTMLVDAGGPTGGVKEAAEATSRFDVGEEVVAPYLWSRHLRHLDTVALTHAHSDHMGGMAAVLRDLRPRELWVGVDAHAEAFRSLLAEARELGIEVRHLQAGEEFGWGGTEVHVLAPEAGYVNGGAPKNDDSLVLRVQFGRSSVLLEGDAEAPSERRMLDGGRIAPVTLLKVGHHGSRTSTTSEFFAALAPRFAVVSVGKGNRFGHPRAEVISRFADAGTRLYRTDEFGLTTFLLGRDGDVHEVVGAGDAEN